ncbi:hypothetical protein ACFQ68_13170 [Amycolatopsis japonica]|uniref:hypothetical protein n=1 Tax=Amycolatopsis japonica TaxID=208439 RepID=UPI00366B09F1
MTSAATITTDVAPDSGALTAIAWRLEAYAGDWLSSEELAAVVEWMADNGLVRATAQHPVVVAAGRVTYGKDLSDSTVRAARREIVTTTVLLRSAPPTVTQPACPPEEMAALQRVLRDHEWSAGFGGVCVDCSVTTLGADGQIRCHRDDAMAWPCGPVRDALAAAGLPAPGHTEQQPKLVFGDFLDPAIHAETHLS